MSLVVPDSMKSAKSEVGMSLCLITFASIRGVGVDLRVFWNVLKLTLSGLF